MPYVKRIVCLANSYKTGGTCVAGREVLPTAYGGWIRPVSARATAEISTSEARYEDNTNPMVLDIIDVPLLSPAPQHHQTENHAIDTTRRWVKVGELPRNMLAELVEHPATLWINSDRTKAGAFNCISQAEAATQHDSLALIRVEDFAVEIGSSTWEGRTKKTHRGHFTHNGTYYNLTITDPVVLEAFAAKAKGDYVLKDAYLCISLTEPAPQDGRCHKLVASVISDSLR